MIKAINEAATVKISVRSNSDGTIFSYFVEYTINACGDPTTQHIEIDAIAIK